MRERAFDLAEVLSHAEEQRLVLARLIAAEAEVLLLFRMKPPRAANSINFRLHTLAGLPFKGARQYYHAHFGVGRPESSDGPLAAYQIEAIIQAGLSRSERDVLGKLLDRMLVASEAPRAEEAAALAVAKRRAVK